RLRLRAQLRVRALSPGTLRRRPARAARELAGLWHPLADPPAQRVRPRPYLRPHRARQGPHRRLQPDVARLAADHPRPARPADRRLPRPDPGLPSAGLPTAPPTTA